MLVLGVVYFQTYYIYHGHTLNKYSVVVRRCGIFVYCSTCLPQTFYLRAWTRDRIAGQSMKRVPINQAMASIYTSMLAKDGSTSFVADAR